MGTGKSMIGHLLAQELNMTFLDTDELIQKTENRTINEIFKQDGEAYFRALETEVIKTLQGYDNFVLSTGGGIVLRAENIALLKAIGPLVLLWAEPETIYERVKKESHRPLLQVADPLAEIKKILDKRAPIYQRVCDFKLDTSGLTPEQAVKEIRLWLESK